MRRDWGGAGGAMRGRERLLRGRSVEMDQVHERERARVRVFIDNQEVTEGQ